MRFILLLSLVWPSLVLAKPNAEAAPSPADAASDADITETVKQAHGDQYAAPPTTFRAGHVSTRTLDASAVTRTDSGFAVQLPAKAPLVSPTVYDGMVFSSGGFRSKEFYAFDARTGAVRWALNLGDDGPSTAACEAGVCVFNTESCTVFAVDARSGALKWSWWLGDPQTSAPTIADGLVYTAYPAGRGHGGPNLSNGINLPNGLNQARRAPVAQNGKAPPPGMTHVLAAFNLQTGKVVWQRWLDSDVMSAPVAHDGDVLVTSFAGTLYRFDGKTGAIRSARTVRATSAPTVAQNGELFYARRDDAGGQAGESIASDRRAQYKANRKRAAYLDRQVQSQSQLAAAGKMNDAANGFSTVPATANSGAALGNVGQGSVYTMQAFQGSRVLNDAAGNISTMGDEVVCTDPATGKTKWSYRLKGKLKTAGGFLAAPPAKAGGDLIIGTLDGHVLRLEPASGKEKARFAVGAPIRAQPVVEGGWIYVGTTNGRLVAINTEDPTLTGWSHWGADAQRSGR
jgi:outer membrane protein assembly factor BamB